MLLLDAWHPDKSQHSTNDAGEVRDRQTYPSFVYARLADVLLDVVKFMSLDCVWGHGGGRGT